MLLKDERSYIQNDIYTWVSKVGMKICKLCSLIVSRGQHKQVAGAGDFAGSVLSGAFIAGIVLFATPPDHQHVHTIFGACGGAASCSADLDPFSVPCDHRRWRPDGFDLE